jgi:hypothetical protein
LSEICPKNYPPKLQKWTPGVNALQEDLLPLGLDHVIGEHGVEVGTGGRQHDAVRELWLVHGVVLEAVLSTFLHGSWRIPV